MGLIAICIAVNIQNEIYFAEIMQNQMIKLGQCSVAERKLVPPIRTIHCKAHTKIFENVVCVLPKEKFFFKINYLDDLHSVLE